jgi:hypothetical protein
VVAGTDAGTVRVGVGVSLVASSEAVFGVMPSGFMGAFLWMGIGGIAKFVCGGVVGECSFMLAAV